MIGLPFHLEGIMQPAVFATRSNRKPRLASKTYAPNGARECARRLRQMKAKEPHTIFIWWSSDFPYNGFPDYHISGPSLKIARKMARRQRALPGLANGNGGIVIRREIYLTPRFDPAEISKIESLAEAAPKPKRTRRAKA